MTIRFLIFSFALSVALAATSTKATVFNVTPSDNWEVMLNGGSFLQPGDELVFGAGVYDAGGTAIKIKYRGTAANPITMRPANGANVEFTRTFNGNPSGQKNMFELLGAQHLTIKGFEFTAGSRTIWLRDDETVPGSRVTTKFVTLEGNHIHHTLGNAITANFSGSTYEGLHFLNNEINNTGAEGEAFYLGCNHNACQMFDSVIEKNYIHDLVGEPGNGFQGDGIEIKLGSYNNIIRDNVIVNTLFPGITAYGVAGQGGPNIIEGNVLIDIQNHGIQVASDAVIRNNLILSSRYDGIHVQNHQSAVPGNLDIINNTIRSNVDNDYSTSFISGHAIRINNPAGGTWSGPIKIDNNALYPDGPDTFQSRSIGTYQLTPGGVTANNNIASATAQDLTVDSSGNLASDFVNIQGLNAFPKAGGKLIGAGAAGLQPSEDFNGTSRSGSNDIGAYRYASGGNPGWTISNGFKQISGGSVIGNGDFDGDFDTDGADFLTWQRVTGSILTGSDLNAWKNNFGASGAVAASTSVPEPGAMVLLSLGASCLLARRPRKIA